MAPDFEIFNKNWSIYQKIVRAGYMRHDIIGKKIADTFRMLEGKPAEIIDLGCGDAEEIAGQAIHFPVKSFTGFDLSDMALKIAEKNLAFVAELSLACEPMESLIRLKDCSANFVFSGFAIHHLEDDMKKMMLKEVHRILRPDGHFLLPDVFRRPGQSRAEYLANYITKVRLGWSVLSEGEKQAVIEHLETSDFPADSEQFLAWASAAGLELIHSDVDDESHLIFHFRKSGA